MADVVCVGILVADIVGQPIDTYPERGKLALVPRMELHPGGAESPCIDDRGRRVGSGRTGAIVELALDLDALELRRGQALQIWLRVLREDVELDRLPRYGELEALVPDGGFEKQNWQV